MGSGANEGARLSLSAGAGVLYYIGFGNFDIGWAYDVIGLSVGKRRGIDDPLTGGVSREEYVLSYGQVWLLLFTLAVKC